jgi:hypothetical protein
MTPESDTAMTQEFPLLTNQQFDELERSLFQLVLVSQLHPCQKLVFVQFHRTCSIRTGLRSRLRFVASAEHADGLALVSQLKASTLTALDDVPAKIVANVGDDSIFSPR